MMPSDEERNALDEWTRVRLAIEARDVEGQPWDDLADDLVRARVRYRDALHASGALTPGDSTSA